MPQHLPEGKDCDLSQAPPSSCLIDKFGRRINYLRLAITDRCNLRCQYCQPESGVPFIPHQEILRFEELERLTRIFVSLGITKIRVTGGEPFARKGCLGFLTRLKAIPGVKSLHITTNGVATAQHLDELAAIGIDGINLSLDTLDRKRFWKITRRDYFPAVINTFHGILERNIPLKINTVVLEDTSDEEILSLSSLAQKFPVSLRFIELMPFSGTEMPGKLSKGDLVSRLANLFPNAVEFDATLPTTARIFQVPDFQGKLGIINGYSREFCSTCNKVRITPSGMLKTCLYDNGVLDIKGLVRNTRDDQAIAGEVRRCIQNRFANGYLAEQHALRSQETSMLLIGG
ncbi:MAG: GTP 3',8-cyclase MoaA [Deltaproteobacteria bacterium]|nr:GTP 3',8-cyclase MoaA [Deltaproteobacteria bacterium]